MGAFRENGLLAVADLGAHAAFLASYFTSSRSAPSTSHAFLPNDLGTVMLFWQTAIVKNRWFEASAN